ncbi:hypothetical protein NGB36_08340 [Streptomyces sp. RB6PN25]|uniref:ATP synthase subunit E n=1 Tax=Streptomyces humicola TaxID=2953240 RepID=A0ABT1PSG3_9ACTN|nr:hypothetical protein [Streptomyces humicola]MCQ4080611.1 hypothetical protein [Streptomyces humicola]
MTTPQAGQADALAPVRTALLRAARTDADALLAQARADAAQTLDAVRAEAQAILDEARRQGEADGAAAARQLRMHAHRAARARQLAARSEVYAELRRQVTEGVRELRHAEEYPAIRDRLAARARRLLGPDASVEEHPGGGVVAVAPGRRVDLTLDALATRGLERCDAEALWAL